MSQGLPATGADAARAPCWVAGAPPLVTSNRAAAGRRTAITFFLEAGKDPHYVQDLVGHEDSRTTMDIYRERRNFPRTIE